jgi:hypothetical protein
MERWTTIPMKEKRDIESVRRDLLGRVSDSVRDTLDELWSWYLEELESSLAGLLNARDIREASSSGTMRALLVDLTTAARISAVRWMDLLDARDSGRRLLEKQERSDGTSSAVSFPADAFAMARSIRSDFHQVLEGPALAPHEFLMETIRIQSNVYCLMGILSKECEQ